MGVCTGDLDKDKNKKIKIKDKITEDFYLTGIIEGKNINDQPPKIVENPNNSKIELNKDLNSNQDNGNQNKNVDPENGEIKELINQNGITRNIEELNDDGSSKKDKEKNEQNILDIKNNQDNQIKILDSDKEIIPSQVNAGIELSQNQEKEIDKLRNANNPEKDNLKNYYEEFDINKNYYLICPDCKLFIVNIDSLEYDSTMNDFKCVYKCSCEENKENYLYLLLNDKQPSCLEHNKEIKYLCEDCKKQICIDCQKENHKEHNLKQIINKDILSDNIMEIIYNKKDDFKGFDIIDKLFSYYKKIPDEPIILKEEKQIENNENSREIGGDKISENNNPEPIKNNVPEINEGDKTSKKSNEEKKEDNIINNGFENVFQEIPENNKEINQNFEEEKKSVHEKEEIPLKPESKNDELNNKDSLINNVNLNKDEKEKNMVSQKEDYNNNSFEQIMNNDNFNLIDEAPQVLQSNNNLNNEMNNNNNINNQNNENIENQEKNNYLNNENQNMQMNININPENNEINSSKNNLNNGKNNEIDLNNNVNNDNLELNNNPINEEMNNNTNDNINIGQNNNCNINPNGNNKLEENIVKNNINDNTNNLNEQVIINENDFNNSNGSMNDKVINNVNENGINVLKQYKNTKIFTGHEKRIVSLIRLSSGYIVTGSYDLSIKIWDITKEPQEALITTKYSVGYMLCLLELKPNELLVGNSENCIDVFNLNEDISDPNLRLFGHSLWVTGLVICDEQYFASSGNDAKIIIWDSNKKIKIRELEGHKDCILTMILLENGNLCTGSADKSIRFWDWKTGHCLNQLKAHNNWVKCLFQFNSQILLSGSDDHKIRLWNMNNINNNTFEELKGHTHSVRTFCKIDENFFASGSFDKTIKIWDIKEMKCINTLEAHNSNVICIINYDGKLISTSSDLTIKVWEEI